MHDHAALALLRAEIHLLWGVDDHGRYNAPPRVAIAVSHAEQAPPPDLLLIKDSLRPPTVITSCLSYLISADTEPSVPPELTLHTSAEPPDPSLLAVRPEQQWELPEWTDLLAGRLGPWAIAVADGRVAALCHAPRDRDGTAEAGVWTHPDHRGRGYAGVVTAAWAQVARETRDSLYYSHFDDNQASRTVARKLGARPIGRIWQLRQQES